MSTKEKHILEPDLALSAQIVVVSDSLSAAGSKRWRKLDKSAKRAEQILKNRQITLSTPIVVPDDIEHIQRSVSKALELKTNLIITIGGTGVAKRDVTIEAIRPLLEKELIGFGELFRQKTYQEVGTVSIMTRTLAGVAQKSCVVCLPGSPDAVILGLKLILEELLHIINLRG
ncbi:MAG: molybdenum cofactor biosynthesis protein B [Candidatus Heimdallarchaeota archaeon]